MSCSLGNLILILRCPLGLWFNWVLSRVGLRKSVAVGFHLARSPQIYVKYMSSVVQSWISTEYGEANCQNTSGATLHVSEVCNFCLWLVNQPWRWTGGPYYPYYPYRQACPTRKRFVLWILNYYYVVLIIPLLSHG